MQRNHIGPQFICFTEHHLKEFEIKRVSLEGNTLASGFCRKVSLGGGVCILIHKSIEHQPIDLSNFCYEKTLEICAVKLQLESLKLIIFCVYTAPTGNLELFFSLMEKMLNHLLQPKLTFLICGDLNINLLTKSNDASKLLTLMNTFNLTQVVDFPMRITINNKSLLDTIFIDITTYNKIQIKPFVNGLLDHDAQIISLNKINLIPKQKVPKIKLRLINNTTTSSFQKLLKEETWNQIYVTSGINETFNIFQDIFLRYFEASFPITYSNRKSKQNNWITKGIRISCNKKRELFTQYRGNTDNIQAKNHYKKYCTILRKVINEAKKTILS